MGTPGTVMIGWPRLVEYCTPCLARGRLAGEVCAAVVVGFGSNWGCFPAPNIHQLLDQYATL